MPSSFSMTTASEVLPRTAASVLRVGERLVRARSLQRGAEPGRDDGGGLDVVRPLDGRRPSGEEERARDLDAAADRHRQDGAEAGCGQDLLDRHPVAGLGVHSGGPIRPGARARGRRVRSPARLVSRSPLGYARDNVVNWSPAE
jgi:hypothetical protein